MQIEMFIFCGPSHKNQARTTELCTWLHPNILCFHREFQDWLNKTWFSCSIWLGWLLNVCTATSSGQLYFEHSRYRDYGKIKRSLPQSVSNADNMKYWSTHCWSTLSVTCFTSLVSFVQYCMPDEPPTQLLVVSESTYQSASVLGQLPWNKMTISRSLSKTKALLSKCYHTHWQ